MADQDIFDGFNKEERLFIESLIANDQVLITDNENAQLPPGMTHLLIVRSGEKSQLIRRRFHGII